MVPRGDDRGAAQITFGHVLSQHPPLLDRLARSRAPQLYHSYYILPPPNIPLFLAPLVHQPISYASYASSASGWAERPVALVADLTNPNHIWRDERRESDTQTLKMAESELHHLLSQLARFCRANDIASSHVLECKSKLSEIDLSALDRFFSLFVYNPKHVGPLSIDPHAFVLCVPLSHDADSREH